MINMRFLIVTLTLFCIQNSFALEKVNTELYQYAKACPTESSKTINKLVSYLSKGGNSASQRVELFCYWIAENIAYDTQGYTTGKYSPTTTILTTKKGVCQNYSELLKSMCTLAGIECHVIKGYSKGYGYTKNKVFQSTDHAWNIVQLDGKYSYIDLTWASGSVKTTNGSMRFVKTLNPAEIFAEPNYFAITHMPGDPRWQLRTNPITLKSFTGSDSLKEMLKTTLSNYNFQDSISVYLQADSVSRNVLSETSTYIFNPTKLNLQYLADALYTKGWYLSTKIGTLPNQEKAIICYNSAMQNYSKLGNTYGNKWITNCKTGIAYCNSQIAALKKSP